MTKKIYLETLKSVLGCSILYYFQINVLFHNDAKFDFRLIIEYLTSKCIHSNISCMAHSMETFLTFLMVLVLI